MFCHICVEVFQVSLLCMCVIVSFVSTQQHQYHHKCISCTMPMIPMVRFFRFLFSAWPIDYEVHVLVSGIRYTDVSHIERSLMSMCLVMTKPFLTGVYLERPCISDIRGRFIYVVMVLMNSGTSTLGVNDLKVYSSRFRTYKNPQDRTTTVWFVRYKIIAGCQGKGWKLKFWSSTKQMDRYYVSILLLYTYMQ